MPATVVVPRQVRPRRMSTEPETERRSAPVPLASLAVGACAVIVDVDGASSMRDRLFDLGCVPGTRVRVVRRAPLGDPMLYELRSYRLSLRRSEAQHILVQPDGPVSQP